MVLGTQARCHVRVSPQGHSFICISLLIFFDLAVDPWKHSINIGGLVTCKKFRLGVDSRIRQLLHRWLHLWWQQSPHRSSLLQ
jgi:hypothetical protein